MSCCRCDGRLDQVLPVNVQLSCKPFICQVEVTSQDDASYVCHYTASQPGFYRLVVTSGDVHLYGSPFSVQVSCLDCLLLQQAVANVSLFALSAMSIQYTQHHKCYKFTSLDDDYSSVAVFESHVACQFASPACTCLSST